MLPRLISLVLFGCCAAAAPCLAQGDANWTRPFPPFRIVGNLYWVGSYDLASYLIDSGYTARTRSTSVVLDRDEEVIYRSASSNRRSVYQRRRPGGFQKLSRLRDRGRNRMDCNQALISMQAWTAAERHYFSSTAIRSAG